MFVYLRYDSKPSARRRILRTVEEDEEVVRRDSNRMVSEFVITNNAISVGVNYTVSFIVQRNGFNSKSSVKIL